MMNETTLNAADLAIESRLLKKAVIATDAMSDGEKAPLIQLLDAVLESAPLFGFGKITVLAITAITNVRQALENAMANAELSEINEEDFNYE
jgi:hypothetical protein